MFKILIPIFFPMIFGIILSVLSPKDRRNRNAYVIIVALTNTLASFGILETERGNFYEILRFSEDLSLEFGVDGMSFIFAMIVTCLWVPATIYAIEYMKHEGHENSFFTFFLMSYGVVLGVAFSGNLLTMYLFYELLTMSTFPLVMHGHSPKALAAGKRYLTFSVAGASFGFIAMMVLLHLEIPFTFVYGGGTAALGPDNMNLVLTAYVLAFFGFGVKGGVFPFHIWLPSAGVAPTPVTALLHAVAVVNAGVFAVLRVTYYSFGANLLYGTYAQYITMAFAAIGIVFGSAMALRSTHIKLRLAYSTVSNLSYMLFSAAQLSPTGLMGALAHMTFHSVLKITLFFVAGALLYITGREYITQVTGLGKKMPITFLCFTICSLGLIGVPPFIGIISKWIIGQAAMENGNIISYLGVLALMVSAFLTCLYLFTIIFPAYIPRGDYDENSVSDIKDPGPFMTVPMLIMTVASIVIAIYSGKLLELIDFVSKGGAF